MVDYYTGRSSNKCAIEIVKNVFMSIAPEFCGAFFIADSRKNGTIRVSKKRKNMSIIMDGVALRNRILEELRKRVEKMSVQPKLVAILVGDDAASKIYVNNKEKYAAIAGIKTEIIRMPADTDTKTIIAKIHKLNADEYVTAVLIQLPLPAHIDTHAVLNAVDVSKDVDGFTDANIGKMYGAGRDFIVPCTPRGILALLDEYKIDVAGKSAVVIGRSNIVGKPMAQLLMMRNATVTICHSRTPNIADFTRNADIVVAATGKITITGDMLKPGAVFIDVGMQRDGNGKLRGDGDFASCNAVAGYITPTPGGTGPMTIAGLMMNTIDLASQVHNISDPEK